MRWAGADTVENANAPQRQHLRALEQSGGDVGTGLWHDGTPFETFGYMHQFAYETQAATSFHILTTDGIRGRGTASD